MPILGWWSWKWRWWFWKLKEEELGVCRICCCWWWWSTGWFCCCCWRWLLLVLGEAIEIELDFSSLLFLMLLMCFWGFYPINGGTPPAEASSQPTFLLILFSHISEWYEERERGEGEVIRRERWSVGYEEREREDGEERERDWIEWENNGEKMDQKSFSSLSLSRD